jgi:Na+-driven multidrug efflux pump
MTVVGQCLGSGKVEEAKYFTARICRMAFIALLVNCLFVFAIAGPVTYLAGMEPDARDLCLRMTLLITIVKPIIWVPSFTPANAMRAAGDVRFSMIAASCTMWICRVMVTTILIRVVGIGAVAVWIGMFMDWGCRGVIFTIRYFSGRWLKHSVI